MKILLICAFVVELSGTAFAQFAKDVTSERQLLLNEQIHRREAVERAIAEYNAEQARQRAAQLHLEQLRAAAMLEAARIEAAARVDAERNRQPDICILCDWMR